MPVFFYQHYTEPFTGGLEAYRSLPEPRAVVGLSMGGLLAAKLAAEEDPQALVALAPYLAWLMPTYKGTNSVRDPERRKHSPNYPYFPTASFAEMLKLSRLTSPLLPRVKAPALVLQAGYDSTVPEEAIMRYYNLLGSRQKDRRLYQESEHDLLLDVQADAVATDIRDWLLQVMR